MLLNCDAKNWSGERQRYDPLRSGKATHKFSGDRLHDAFDQIVAGPEATVIQIEGLGGNHVALVVLDAAGEDRLVGLHVVDRRQHGFPGRVVFEATDADLAAAPKTPVLKSQRTPKDFRNPTIKTNRRLSRDSSYVAEFVNTPIRLEDVAVELSDEEAAMLDGLRPSTEPTTALRCATSCSRGGSRNFSAPPRAERRRLGIGGRKAARQPSFRCEQRMALTCLIDFVLLTNSPSPRLG